MISQLNMLGEPVTPPLEGLGPVQREVMRELARLGTLSRDEAGAIAHERRGKHPRGEVCAFCGVDGTNIVNSLLERGVVETAPEGHVQLPRHLASSDVTDDEDAVLQQRKGGV